MVSARQILAVLSVAAIAVACSNNPKVSATPSGGGVAATPAPQGPPAGATRGAAPPVAARGGPPSAVAGGGAPGGAPPGRGARLAPDSVTRLRAMVIDSFAKAAVGHESDKAGSYYANVTTSLKDQTVGEFLKTMDAYGKAITGQCSSCHVVTDYSADTRPNKGRARIMQNMTDVINTDHLPKISPTRPPKATCMTCHHGQQTPNQSLDAALQKANEAAGYLPPAAAAGGRGGGGGGGG